MRFAGNIVLLAAIYLVSWAAGANAAEGATISEISLADLKKAMAEKKVTLIDCNGTKTYNKNHIPGAIDFDANESILAQILPKEKDALIVAYCGNEKCHMYQRGANAAVRLGYTRVEHYAPGITGWIKAGEPVESIVSK